MIKDSDKEILKIIKFRLPVYITLAFLLILFIIYFEKTLFIDEEKKILKQELIEKNKIQIKQNVETVINIIKNEQKTTEENLIKELKQYLNTANTIAENLYYQYMNEKSKEEIKDLIIETLRNIRFNEGRGYYFVYDMKGNNLLLPPNPQYEGLNFINHKDIKGKYIVRELIDNLKVKDEVVLDWYWYKPGSLESQRKKIGIAKKLKNFDLFIGTGEYLEDFENKTKTKILKDLEKIKFGKHGYIFVFDYNYIYLSHIKKDYISKSALKLGDTQDIKLVLDNLKNYAINGGGYYSYIQNEKPGTNQNTLKTSYVKNIDEWEWIVGTGYYEDDLQNEIEIKKEKLVSNLERYFLDTVVISFIVIISFIAILLSFSTRLQKLFKNYNNEIANYIKQTNKQHQILAQQSKMVAMGEMIGNIAHQWRQPLSAITSSASIVKLKKELNTFDEDECIETLDTIISQANYLSTTIDDFRYFFAPNKDKKNFKSDEIFTKTLKFTKSEMTKNGITLISRKLESFNIYNYENELLQVLLNILNNSKDEFNKVQNNKHKYIFVDIFKTSHNVHIEIKDSAGGISQDIINRVFEPYFTTKHKSKGTGIGLYMSLEIIKKHFGGDIEVENVEYEYNDIELKGAEFRIVFPI